MECRVGSDHLTKHNMADIHGLMVLISVDNLWNYGDDSDFIAFPALSMLKSSTLYLVVRTNVLLK
jgi:hypothetical protein